MEDVNRFNFENDCLTKMVLDINKRNGLVVFGGEDSYINLCGSYKYVKYSLYVLMLVVAG